MSRKAKPAADGLDDLYRGDFDGFVARRDALAKRLKADGDDGGAAEVKALKKPSRTAWAVNQFVAHEKNPRDELLRAGADLREAQEGLVSGDGDREAMIKARDRERAAVAGAMDAIAKLAAEAGPALSGAAAERARQTLHAVALDDDIRARFEAARLTTDHEASGLGGGSASASASATAKSGGAKPKSAAKRGKEREAQKRKRRREELKAAEADAAKRDRVLEAAELELREAKQAARRAQGDLRRATKQQERALKAAEDAAGRVAKLRDS